MEVDFSRETRLECKAERLIMNFVFSCKMASAAAELVAEREPEPRMEIVDANRTYVGAESLVRMAIHQYQEILTTVSDPRVNNWPLMDSPIPTVLIVATYLYTVTILGPRIMANRKPFRLKAVLLIYNAFQVIFSLGMMYEVIHYYFFQYQLSTFQILV